MGARVDYLHSHPQSGVLYYRRLYPDDLRAVLGRQLKRSLGAKSTSEPGLWSRFEAVAAEYDQNVAKARKSASGTFDQLDAPTIAYLAEAFRVEALTDDDASRWDEGERELYRSIAGSLAQAGGAFVQPMANNAADRWALKRDQTAAWTLPRYIALKAAGDLEGIVALWRDEATDLAEAHGYHLDPLSAPFRQLCRAVNDAAIQAAEAALERLEGRDVPTPVEPLPPSPSAGTAASTPQAAPGTSFNDIAEAVLANPRLKVGASTAQATRTALRFFREVHGDALPPAAITRRHVAEWLDMLAQRPARLQAAERDWPLRKVLERYADRPDVPRLKGKTLNQHSGALSAVWKTAQRKLGLIPDDQGNPFSGHAVAEDPTPETPVEFSPEELNAIFRLPVFTTGDRPAGGKGEASYWLPLLLLFTGARPEELAQLMVQDVLQDQESGRWLLRITNEGEHPHKGRRTLKTERKHSGRRTFPIHPELLRLGFIAYVDAIRAAGETALFPLLRPKGERRELFAAWSAWWSAYVQKHGVLPAGEGRRAAREFRHAWTTAARACRIPEEAREYLQGHVRTGSSANTGYGGKASLGEYVDQLTFAGLDLSSVRPWVAKG